MTTEMKVVHSKVVFKLFSSIIINSLLVNNGLNSTVHIRNLFEIIRSLYLDRILKYGHCWLIKCLTLIKIVYS